MPREQDAYMDAFVDGAEAMRATVLALLARHAFIDALDPTIRVNLHNAINALPVVVLTSKAAA